jgi:hypothetical protein
MIPARALSADLPVLALDDFAQQAAAFARATTAKSTRCAYAKDWQNLTACVLRTAWCCCPCCRRWSACISCIWRALPS